MQFGKPYPLIGTLATECFGREIATDQIEQAFSTAIKDGHREPIDRLVSIIQHADHYVGWEEAKALDSPYSALLDHFEDAQFLSFNYDSLVELILLRRGEWFPQDGFGVSAEVGNSRVATGLAGA